MGDGCSGVRGKSKDMQKGGPGGSTCHLRPLGLCPRSETPDKLRAHPVSMQVDVLFPETSSVMRRK